MRPSGSATRTSGGRRWRRSAEGRALPGGGADGMTAPLICPLLIGRDDELTELRAFLGTGDGAGGVALVSGEAGVGKRRLVDELPATPEADAYRVARAACLR